MKIVLSPMPALRVSAVARINAHFNSMAQPHVDAAHAAKRKAASAGVPYPDWFAQEAALRGITADALADLVTSKPDNVAARELERQRTLAKVDAAKTPAELDAITKV